MTFVISGAAPERKACSHCALQNRCEFFAFMALILQIRAHFRISCSQFPKLMRPAQRILLLALALSPCASAGELHIAAASDLKFAMEEIVNNFKNQAPDEQISISYGSSGMFLAQIQQGAPYDLFFSADIDYPRALAAKGLAGSEVRPYARGRIVLWSPGPGGAKMRFERLGDAQIARIAIANPKHAPYGKRAEEALRAAGVWANIEPKLIFGENIAQAAQFVQTGNAQVGIVALSLALNPSLAAKGSYWLIPETLHQPLEQGYVVTARAARNPLAKRFADYIGSPPARAVMTRYGFALPGERLAP
ncbi:molybdate ABC transporter substrate-binding protein [Niveibacterium sp.]|uniref:molybdate ABC transporter substrate-binding protein n=1 Tax=Niveibacterium sp. TaxID=2017444 RepID=UPI0035B14CC8